MDNYIKRFFDQEEWKEVPMKEPFGNKFELFVSNYGLIKRTTKANGETRLLRQSLTEGYPTANFSILTPLTEKESLVFVAIRQEIADLKIKIKKLKLQLSGVEDKNIELEIAELELQLSKKTVAYKKKYSKSETKRKKTFYLLVHRVLAIAFLERPSELHNLVAHLDFDKENNHHSNLKWMTREENVEHQKKSPHVIKSKIKAKDRIAPQTSKLTVNQVMIVKKRLQEEGVNMALLAKRYKITQTQLLRIKRGENWAKIPAAL